MSKIEDFTISNWQEQLNNCFEVNINSSKLNELLTDLMGKIQVQEQKIMAINDKVSFISDSTSKKVKDSYSDFNFLIIELKKEIKNQIKAMQDEDHKNEKIIAQNLQQQTQLIDAFAKDIQMLKKQLNQRAAEFQIMDQNFFGGMIREKFIQSQKVSKQNIQQKQNQFCEQDFIVSEKEAHNRKQKQKGKSIQFHHQDLQDSQNCPNFERKSRFFRIDTPKRAVNGKNFFHIIESLKQQLQIYKQQSKTQFTKLNQLIMKQDFSDRNIESQAYLKGTVQTKTIKNLTNTVNAPNFTDFQRSQSRLKSSKKKIDDAERKLQFAIFSSKLEKLQKAIDQINSQAINKVMYPRPSSKRLRTHRRSTFFKRTTEFEIQQKLQEQQFTNQIRLLEGQQIQSRIASIYQRITQVQSQLSKEVSFARDRITTIEEKHHFVMRKIDKLNHDSNQAKVSLKKLFDTIIQEQVILNLRKQLKKLNKDMEMGLQLQLTKQQFIKEQIKITSKMNILHEHLTDKADKDEIKRALIFLEDKVKEIVVLIAHGQIDEKNGALSRIPFKCLSCDRDVQNSNNIPQQKLKKLRQIEQNKRPKSIQRITNKVHAKMRLTPTITMMTQLPIDSD